jgi:CTP synthase
MQIAVIEFARNVLGLSGANSSELDPQTPYPVVDLMPDQENVTILGGTMRLGRYPCQLDPKSKSFEVYVKGLIFERHRHRYEINNSFRDQFEKNGIILAGLSPDKHIVEMIEIEDHPWYVACQFHPEFKSRPNRPHPLFFGFIRAAEAASRKECI